MLRLLLLSLLGLALFQIGVAAPAVGTTISTLAPVPTASPFTASHSVTIANPPSNVCKDLDNCRSLFSIVQSCLLTIFACVWVAVHRNIPGPEQSWISVHLEWLKVLVLTALVPEWILAWAVRQFLRARALATKLEEARISAQEKWNGKRQAPIVETNDRSARGKGEGAESEIGTLEGERDDGVPLIPRRSIAMDTGGAGTTGDEAPDAWVTETNLGRTNERWTTTHAFFTIMGSFHYYQNGKPLYPLHPDEVVYLVRCGALVPPTWNELSDRSKGDALSKGVAVIQTLWFVTQCIVRCIEHLPITNLEVMTLAYTVITVAMYAAWWHKPLNISCSVRVSGQLQQNWESVHAASADTWERIFEYVMGDQDYLVVPKTSQGRLNYVERVPTFWSGGYTEDNKVITADIIALLVAICFGAAHAIAWSYAFSSHIEQLMWRISAITITVVPAVMTLVAWLTRSFILYSFSGLMEYFGVVCLATCAIIYISGRLILFILLFTTLKSLPFGAYQTVQWTNFIPHI